MKETRSKGICVNKLFWTPEAGRGPTKKARRTEDGGTVGRRANEKGVWNLRSVKLSLTVIPTVVSRPGVLGSVV